MTLYYIGILAFKNVKNLTKYFFVKFYRPHRVNFILRDVKYIFDSAPEKARFFLKL